jgi:hypothetical protein
LIAAADRIHDLGFNLIRLWDRPTLKPYTKGDNSADDMLAFFLNELDKRGVNVWCSVLFGEECRPEDVNLINDPVTATAWQDAIKKAGGTLSTWSVARVWDRRLEAASMAYKAKMASWPNHYKGGIRWADDPQVVVWEFLNEERWYPKMFRGEWMHLPKFFQDELLKQWNDFVMKKYGSDEKLKDAWLGLLPGESLNAGTVQLTPLLRETGIVMPSDANPLPRCLHC